MSDTLPRAPLRSFLAQNPFPNGLTGGLFYREKMRAIHRIAPAHLSGRVPKILEVGGGRSGLAAMLYPGADITSLDLDPVFAAEPVRSDITFVTGDARALPFADAVFDIVTLFDVLEHIDEDGTAAAEALRVARPGGTVLVSCPDADWRYPYYRFLAPIAGSERALMDEWGHVRRGYEPSHLAALFGRDADRRASFIGPLTSIYHDIAFSRLGSIGKAAAYLAASPLALAGYLTDRGRRKGSETAYAWDLTTSPST